MPRENELPSFESLLEFQEVYMRAVALAWCDEKFKAALLADPGDALKNYFGYVCPWNIDLQVQLPEGPDMGWDPKKREWNLPRVGTSFGLPAAPPSIDQQLIAFAAYNDAGPTYLFTCC